MHGQLRTCRSAAAAASRFSAACLRSSSEELLRIEQEYAWPNLLPDGKHNDATYGKDGKRARITCMGEGTPARDVDGDALSRGVHTVDFAGGQGCLLYVRGANLARPPDRNGLAFTSSSRGIRSSTCSTSKRAIRRSCDGKEILYLALDGKVRAIPVVLGERPTFGEPKALLTISTTARAAIHAAVGFDVSPDGQRFTIPVVTSAEDPAIIVVRNWER